MIIMENGGPNCFAAEIILSSTATLCNKEDETLAKLFS
jgi:hypothetical protein